MTDSTDSSCSNDFVETNDSSSTVTDQLESHVPDYSTDLCQPSDQSDSNDKENLKRKSSETAPIDEPSRLKKSDISDTPSFLDIIKSVVKDDPNKVDNFNVLTNTKEYDCPIAKLAKLNPGDSFLKASKSDNSSDFNQTYKSETPGTSESTEENDNTEEDKTVLDSSISEDESLLREIDCKLSVYKNSEWSLPVPVVTQLIQNKTTSNKRVVCFQFGTGRLLLNTVLLPSMSFNKLKDRSIIFNGQPLGENLILIPHRLIFPDSSLRDDLHNLYSK